MCRQEPLHQGERVDSLIRGGLKIIQNEKLPRFALDAVLLADFVIGKQAARVADLGTGTGIIPLLLAVSYPDAEFFALEIMPGLCEMASRSVKLNRLQDRIKIINEDILNCDKVVEKDSIDLVVSNPPYRKKGQCRISPDPSKAAYQCEVYCTMADIIEKGRELLKTGGSLSLIQRIERLDETAKLMSFHGVAAKRLRLVKSFGDKEAGLFLIEGEKGYKGECRETPPLIIFDSPGVYSGELKEIFSR